MKKVFLFITAISLLALFTGGCADITSITGTPVEGESNFKLLISDEANDIWDFSSLNITITKIGLNTGNSENWTYPEMDPITVDLRQLIGDNATAVFNGYVPSDNYTKVMIYTENITGTLLDGETITVKLPSGKLHISKPFTLSEESVVDFVFDITVVKAGNSGKYILKPQIAESGPNMKFTEITPNGNTEKNQEKNKEKNEEKNENKNQGKNGKP
jgi:hypothetical protein